jgi:putative peptide zinc metalloprotease protein
VIARAALPAWLRRPAVLALFSVVALAALLSGGLVVAHAVEGTPTAEASPSSSGGNGDSNAAVGVNTKDGKTVYAIRLKIVQVTGDAVDAGNAAVAVNSGCTDCSTVAVAFEGVVVVGSPTDFQPTNLALAMNVDCSGCTAFADAYQQVVQTSTRVRVTKAGRRQIASIRKDLDDLKHSDLTLDQIRARVAADEQAFAEVLRTQLTPVGHVTEPAPADAPDVSDNADAPTADQGASESASPATDAGSPSTDASPSPDASSPTPDSGSPTADPTPTASSTP